MLFEKRNRRGQLTIFIIVAIFIVVGVVSYFVFRDSISQQEIPVSIEPVYTSFLSCLEEDILQGIDVLESQGGYIYLPEFEPGSDFMPFSSELNFLGNPIPYWYYVSGNNVQREKVPSRKNMEEHLGEFVEEKIVGCDLDIYYEQGFRVIKGEPNIKVNIKGSEVDVDLDMDLSVSKGEDSVLVKDHNLLVKSELGNLYDSARMIYEKEQETLFLEDYAVDTLRMYTPVDGVELTCSPETWIANDVFDDLQEAIEANTLALKVKGGDYSLVNEENKYFVVDVPVDKDVRFVNSRNWPYSFEVAPSEGDILISNPVGNQPGLGAMGFCYVPYHFVYDIKYPVLVQVYSDDVLGGVSEIFQFPLAVVVQGNKPREALDVGAVGVEVPELCKYKNTLVEVNVYDSRLNYVDADISYECFGVKCDIGKTSGGILESEFPQCVNGYILVSAEGFEDAKHLYSTTNPGFVDVVLDRLYDIEIGLKLDGVDYNGNAIVSFILDDFSKTVVYPEQKSVELSEGQYEIQVHIYEESSLKLEASSSEQCVEVPQSGLGGLFGLTKEKCFEVEVPAQIVSSALSGGGKENYYVLESELKDSIIIEIDVGSLPVPKTIEQLQDNYNLFDEKSLEVYFK
ncbi:hypothetical protein ACFL0X_00205 [Nanoarchaeota archaeon]